MGGIRGEYIYDDKGNIIDATGGLKAAMTISERHGNSFFQDIGSAGGKAKVPKGFALMNAKDHRKASQKGGSTSRRGRQTSHYKEKPNTSVDVQDV